nr:hypothetical protein [Chloroflexota bacterium]
MAACSPSQPLPAPTTTLSWRPTPVSPLEGAEVDASAQFVFEYPLFAQAGYYLAPPAIRVFDDGGFDQRFPCWSLETETLETAVRSSCALAQFALPARRAYQWQVIPGGCDEPTCGPGAPRSFRWVGEVAEATLPPQTEVRLISPEKGALVGPGPSFRWSPVEAGGTSLVTYRLEIYADGGLIAEFELLSGVEYDLPPAQTLTPGRVYFWRIIANTAASSKPASEFRSFRVASATAEVP